MTAPAASAAGLSLLVWLIAAHPGAPQAPSRPQASPATPRDEKADDLRQALARQLDTDAAALDGVAGYSVVDLTTGERFGRLERAVFATASTIKIAILYELFRQVDEGRIAPDDPRPLDRRHAVGGTGILRELSTPTMSLRDYATLMIVLSDNTATNVLIDGVGMQNVNARMASMGLPEIRLRRRMIDLEAARRGEENVATPAGIARLLEAIHKGEGLSKESREAVLSILKKAKSTALRRGVPAGIEVANKPGSLEGVAVDAGIVYVERRPYIFSMMTTFLKDDDAGEAAIERASRRVYDYFNRLARSSEYGRRIR